MSHSDLPDRYDPAARALIRLLPEVPAREEEATIAYLRRSALPLDAVLLALLDQSDDCIKVIDSDGRLAFMNCNGKRVMQIDDFEAVRGRPWRDLWPAEARPLVDQALDLAEQGVASRFEGDCPTAKGIDKRWEVSVSPVRAPDGQILATVSTSRDISASGARPA